MHRISVEEINGVQVPPESTVRKEKYKCQRNVWKTIRLR